MNLALLDTDILSEVLRERSANVRVRAVAYLREHGKFAFSTVTRFEIRRGYKLKADAALLQRFEEFCAHSLSVPLTDAILDRAEDLWVQGRRQGRPAGDADLIIAATAITLNMELVTGNQRHFDWIPALTVLNWRDP